MIKGSALVVRDGRRQYGPLFLSSLPGANYIEKVGLYKMLTLSFSEVLEGSFSVNASVIGKGQFPCGLSIIHVYISDFGNFRVAFDNKDRAHSFLFRLQSCHSMNFSSPTDLLIFLWSLMNEESVCYAVLNQKSLKTATLNDAVAVANRFFFPTFFYVSSVLPVDSDQKVPLGRGFFLQSRSKGFFCNLLPAFLVFLSYFFLEISFSFFGEDSFLLGVTFASFCFCGFVLVFVLSSWLRRHFHKKQPQNRLSLPTKLFVLVFCSSLFCFLFLFILTKFISFPPLANYEGAYLAASLVIFFLFNFSYLIYLKKLSSR